MTSNVEYITGDIFTTTQPALGHGVNIYGVMGSGIAVLVRQNYPKVFPPYKAACDAGLLLPGTMLPVEVEDDFWVLNLASQDKPGRNARYLWVEQSTDAAFTFAKREGLPGFALPRIGAGVGGLKWPEVTVVLERVAAKYPDIHLELWSLPNADD